MKILIISYWYRPFETIGVRRVGALVDYLRGEGYTVKVLTVKDTKWAHDGLRSTENAHEDVGRLRGFSWAPTVRRLTRGRIGGQATRASDEASGQKVSFLRRIYEGYLTYPDDCWPWLFLGRSKALSEEIAKPIGGYPTSFGTIQRNHGRRDC